MPSDRAGKRATRRAPPDDDRSRLVGLRLPRLAWVAPGVAEQDGLRDQVLAQGWWESIGQVAVAWQQLGVRAEWWETWAVVTSGAQPDRPAALLGLMESAGEQLALAAAALVEARLWQLHRDEAAPEPALDDQAGIDRAVGDEMAQRAMAESAMFSLLAVGHAVANAIGRALTFTDASHAAAVELFHPKRAVDVPPFEPWSQKRWAWLSLNDAEVRQLQQLADLAPAGSVRRAMPGVAAAIVASSWSQLKDVRDTSWHRLRPRTPGLAGAPTASLWGDHPDGKVLLVSDRSGGRHASEQDLADPSLSATALTDTVLEVAVVVAAQMALFLEQLQRLRAEHPQPTVEEADPEAAAWRRDMFD